MTLGTALPAFEVLTAAVNSGLVAYPTAYAQVWSDSGATIWRPAAPEGYVAAGDIVTLTPEPPRLSAMLCLHGECYMFFYLPDGRACTYPCVAHICCRARGGAEHVWAAPVAASQAARLAGSLSSCGFIGVPSRLLVHREHAGNLLCSHRETAADRQVQQQAAWPGWGSRLCRAARPGAKLPVSILATGCCYDLRNPLGVSPASLASLPAAAPEAQEHGRCASVRRSVPAGPRLPSSPQVSVQEHPCSSGL